jgi:hypothetical protein
MKGVLFLGHDVKREMQCPEFPMLARRCNERSDGRLARNGYDDGKGAVHS